jgi:hypothetical protein
MNFFQTHTPGFILHYVVVSLWKRAMGCGQTQTMIDYWTAAGAQVVLHGGSNKHMTAYYDNGSYNLYRKYKEGNDITKPYYSGWNLIASYRNATHDVGLGPYGLKKMCAVDVTAFICQNNANFYKVGGFTAGHQPRNENYFINIVAANVPDYKDLI